MFPVVQVGPLSFQAPGLILLIGLWVGLVLSEHLAPRFKAHPNQVYNLVFVALISGVIGARVSYLLQHLQAFAESPASLFSLNPGLLDPVGGAAVGIIAALIYGNRKQISWPQTMDAIVPLLSIMIIALGLANFSSGDAFGSATDLPWGIYIWGEIRHPTQIYQSLAGLLILGLVWPRQNASEQTQRMPGRTFLLFLALSSAAWMMIENFRGDSILLPGGFRATQLFAWVVLAISLWGLGKIKKPLN